MDKDIQQDLQSDGNQKSRTIRIRNLVAFWLFGLCTDYMYALMLSAAYDLLGETWEESDSSEVTSNRTKRFDCNSLSTGAILLADIAPELLFNLLAPWFAHLIPYDFRVIFCVGLAILSCLLVALSSSQFLIFVGVALTSLSTGVGDFTFASLMSFYDKNVVSSWSSGSGMAGLLGSISYAGLTQAGLAPRLSILLQMIVPVCSILSYWCILVQVPTPPPMRHHPDSSDKTAEERPLAETSSLTRADDDPEQRPLTFQERLHHLKHLVRYILPLSAIYLFTYFINHGLLELVYVDGIQLSHKSQYRWFQVMHQLGVFLSRSSVNVVTFQRLWIFPVAQCCVLVTLLLSVYFAYTPNIVVVVFAAVFVEGLVAGASYVNTYYQITQRESPMYKEFAMGATTTSESLGIVAAGLIAMPVHDAFCGL